MTKSTKVRGNQQKTQATSVQLTGGLEEQTQIHGEEEPALTLEQLYPNAAEAAIAQGEQIEADTTIVQQTREEPTPIPEGYDAIRDFEHEEFTNMYTVVYVPALCIDDYAKTVRFIGEQIKNAKSDDELAIAYKWYYAIPQLFLTMPRNGKHTQGRITNLISKRCRIFLEGKYKEVLDLWVTRKHQEVIYLNRRAAKQSKQNIDQLMVNKIMKGDMRRGIKMGMGYRLADSKDESVRDQVRMRHPQQAEGLREWQHGEDDRIEVDRGTVMAVLAKQDMYTAPGVRGLRPHHIKCLTESNSEEARRAFEVFIELGNKFWNMEMPKIERQKLAAGIIVCANKDEDKRDQRPIKMEDYDMQMWCKAEAIISKQAVVEECLPEQLGIGVSAGVETMVLGMQLEIEMASQRNERKVLAKFDIYNAFQEFNRQYLISVLDKKIQDNPMDVRWRRLRKVAYGLMDLSPRVYMQGRDKLEHICDSRNGGGQGNALTPIFFALVINAVMKDLSAKFPQLLIKAIHDDINVFGDPDVIFGDFWNEFNGQLVSAKLKLQQVKTQVYVIGGLRVHLPQWVKRPCVVDDQGNIRFGIKLCQIPVGDKEFVIAKLAEKGNQIIHQIERVTKVVAARDRRLALATLHYSSQNLADYFLRCVSPDYAQEMENSIDETLAEMYVLAIGVNVLKEEEDQFTPHRVLARIKNGGLGIRWLRMRPNFISSTNLVFTQIANRGEENNAAIWPSIARVLGSMEGQNRWRKLSNVI